MAGTYTVEISAPCYQTATFTVTTRPGVGIRHDVELQPQVEAPVAFDQYILPGMQTTVVALATHEVHWYDSDTASQAIAVGDYFTTPVLFDTTTYYLEEQFQDDTLLCTSSRSSVTVYILGNTSVSEHNEDSGLKIFPNPTGDFLTIDVGSEPLRAVSVYDAEGKQVLTKRVSVSGGGGCHVDKTRELPPAGGIRGRTLVLGEIREERGEIVVGCWLLAVGY